MTLKQENLYPIAFFALLVALIPWAISQFTNAINPDIAFLTLSAGRMLDGMSMSQGYYDTNPPLSMILQIPAVLLSKLGIPIYHATNIYVFALLALSIAATNILLKRMDTLKPSDRYIILSIFLLTNTLKMGHDFGQKDQLLALGLFPLVLLQILITQKVKLSAALTGAILIPASILILLKPHYGIVPAALFFHRSITQKRMSIIRDSDFLALSGMFSLYCAAIIFLFPDFLNIILPDILKYYANDIYPSAIHTAFLLMTQAFMILVIVKFFLKNVPPLIHIFLYISILCLIPFMLQGKGWSYQATAATIFFNCAMGLLLKDIAERMLVKLKVTQHTQNLSFFCVACVITYSLLISYKNISKIPSHEQYKNSTLASIVKTAQTPCSFLLLNDMINMTHELSIYTGCTHASRFPYMWFSTFFLNKKNTVDLKTQQKFTTILAQDIKEYEPETIIIGHFPFPSEKEKLFNYFDYLQETDPKFTKIWENYELEKTLNIDRLAYMERKLPNEGLIRYDIYRKKKAR